MKKILITGGAGYVGTELTRYLLSKGYHVKVIDLFIYGNENLYFHKNLKLIKCDIRDIYKISKEVKGFDTIIHLASVSNDPGYEMDARVGLEINLEIMDRFIKICKKNGIKKFIYPSSCSIYGNVSQVLLTEESNANPLTIYSKCKLKCEKIIKFHSDLNFNTRILRPATICGYSHRQRFDLTVNNLINQFYHNKKVIIKGPTRIRPSLHIKDMIRAYEILIEDDSAIYTGQIYNLAYENLSVIQIANSIEEKLNIKRDLCFIDSNDFRSYMVDSSKIDRHYQFVDKFSIKDAVSDIVEKLKTGQLHDTFKNKIYYNKMIQKKFLTSFSYKT